MNVAAIDCGTNSIRLLIAAPAAGGEGIEDVVREMRIVRLGQDVDRTKRFHPDALARTFEAAREYAEIIEREGVGRLRFAATSATRDAANREEFLTGIEQILGTRPEVVSGEEEARLSFSGATRVIGDDAGGVLVVDLGGGSTEFVLAAASSAEVRAVSLDVGSVRITERHLHSDPPTAAEIDAARRDLREQLAGAGGSLPLGRVDTLVGVAGTITTVTAHALALSQYEPKRINGARLTPEQIYRACADLLHRSRAERGELAFIHPGRIDVVGAGALIWQEIVHLVQEEARRGGRTPVPVITSEHDILDGLALSLI